MSNGACKFSPFLEMSSTAGNEWSNCQHCVKQVQTIETQFRQYHVTKVGGRHICEPHDHKSGGLEPLGPIGVYAYGSATPLRAKFGANTSTAGVSAEMTKIERN